VKQFEDLPPETDSDKNSKAFLFKMVFQSLERIGKPRQIMQTVLAGVFTVILVVQVVWALMLIPEIVLNKTIIESTSLPFISLLVTAILAEVVGMTFVVVRYVFQSPITELIGVLKEFIRNDNISCMPEDKTQSPSEFES